MTILDSWNDLRPKSNIRCTLKMHSDLVTSLAAALAQWSEDVGSNDEVRVRFPVDAFQENFEKLILQIHQDLTGSEQKFTIGIIGQMQFIQFLLI